MKSEVLLFRTWTMSALMWPLFFSKNSCNNQSVYLKIHRNCFLRNNTAVSLRIPLLNIIHKCDCRSKSRYNNRRHIRLSCIEQAQQSGWFRKRFLVSVSCCSSRDLHDCRWTFVAATDWNHQGNWNGEDVMCRISKVQPSHENKSWDFTRKRQRWDWSWSLEADRRNSTAMSDGIISNSSLRS